MVPNDDVPGTMITVSEFFRR